MFVYLASWFSSKDLTKARASELQALGLTVTSRWLDEAVKPSTLLHEVSEEYLIDTANIDLNDIDRADVVILFTEDPLGHCHPRGGRHFESGYAVGRGIRLITVGPKENVFHYLETVENFPTWEDARTYLFTEHTREQEARANELGE